jgi:hypothetical protein
MIRNNSVSIVIPTYNHAHLLSRAIESVFNNCRAGDEIIVVDDNGGAGRARNIGIAAASHDLIAFLDSDDKWIPGSLEARRRYMEARPDTLFCFGDFVSRLPNGVEERNYLANWHKDTRSWSEILGPGAALGALADVPAEYAEAPVPEGSLYLAEMHANYVFASVLMVRKSAAGDALHFWEEVPWCEDWACYARLAALGRAAYLDCHMALQHGHEGTAHQRNGPVCPGRDPHPDAGGDLGSDNVFLSRHREEYDRVLRAAILYRVRASLARGRTAEARKLLERVGGGPFVCEVLARIPQRIARTLLLAKKGYRKATMSFVYATLAADLLSDAI